MEFCFLFRKMLDFGLKCQVGDLFKDDNQFFWRVTQFFLRVIRFFKERSDLFICDCDIGFFSKPRLFYLCLRNLSPLTQFLFRLKHINYVTIKKTGRFEKKVTIKKTGKSERKPGQICPCRMPSRKWSLEHIKSQVANKESGHFYNKPVTQ